MTKQHDITGLLQEVNNGSKSAFDKLYPLVYNEMRKLAGSQISHNPHAGTGLTMSKTDLVHEAYLKLTACPPDIEWKNRGHFYGIAARCMRSILIDYVRKKTAEKRGGNRQAITYIDQFVAEREDTEILLEIDNALKKLDKLNDRLVRVVELRYFLGLNIPETANILDISVSTVKRDWAKARGWLYKELKSA